MAHLKRANLQASLLQVKKASLRATNIARCMEPPVFEASKALTLEERTKELEHNLSQVQGENASLEKASQKLIQQSNPTFNNKHMQSCNSINPKSHSRAHPLLYNIQVYNTRMHNLNK